MGRSRGSTELGAEEEESGMKPACFCFQGLPAATAPRPLSQPARQPAPRPLASPWSCSGRPVPSLLGPQAPPPHPRPLPLPLRSPALPSSAPEPLNFTGLPSL